MPRCWNVSAPTEGQHAGSWTSSSCKGSRGSTWQKGCAVVTAYYEHVPHIRLQRFLMFFWFWLIVRVKGEACHRFQRCSSWSLESRSHFFTHPVAADQWHVFFRCMWYVFVLRSGGGSVVLLVSTMFYYVLFDLQTEVKCDEAAIAPSLVSRPPPLSSTFVCLHDFPPQLSPCLPMISPFGWPRLPSLHDRSRASAGQAPWWIYTNRCALTLWLLTPLVCQGFIF